MTASVTGCMPYAFMVFFRRCLSQARYTDAGQGHDWFIIQGSDPFSVPWWSFLPPPACPHRCPAVFVMIRILTLLAARSVQQRRGIGAQAMKRESRTSAAVSTVPAIDTQPAHGMEPVRFSWPSLFVAFDRAPWFVPLRSTGIGGTNSTCGIPSTSLLTLRLRTDDLQLRPPLRQLWFHHPRPIPEGMLMS